VKTAALLVLAATSASARPLHGSVSVGGSLLGTGEGDGSRLRADVEVDLEPSRYGGLLALRAFDKDHKGLLCGGLIYEGAAARPRLVLALHADLGADLDARAPLVGGGIRATLVVVGPLALAYDGGAYLVIDGVDHSRLVLSSAAMLAVAW
jgi:hypothetical protein